jgi:cysteine-rich repeat protein
MVRDTKEQALTSSIKAVPKTQNVFASETAPASILPRKTRSGECMKRKPSSHNSKKWMNKPQWLLLLTMCAACGYPPLEDLCGSSICGPGQICATHQDICINFGGCGDGIISGDEVCDDGNIIDGDGCSSNCRSNETCGNGMVDFAVGEVCDGGDNCNTDCRFLRCGNGIIDPGEDCDSYGIDSLGCNANCTFARCGDQYVNAISQEQCDTGRIITADCNGPLCTKPTCGDGFFNQAAGEECDAGSADTSGCNGNGNGLSANAPSSYCHIPMCGDGYTNTRFHPLGSSLSEQCDTYADSAACNGDGNGDSRNSKNSQCQIPRCGDGYVNSLFIPPGASLPENCDTGIPCSGGKTCNSMCRCI